MNKEVKQSFLLLKDYRHKLNKQQYRTFKGQILSGDIDGFRTGLFNVMKRKIMK